MSHRINLKVWIALTFCVTMSSAHALNVDAEYERLKVRNTFKTPEEVVNYYCARDASGFVWSGLLDSERIAFTSWGDSPQTDSFYVARSYVVKPAEAIKHDKNLVSVQVNYQLSGTGDAHGTRAPSSVSEYTVTFDLKKTDGHWKIVKPDYTEISPVVLEAKFR